MKDKHESQWQQGGDGSRWTLMTCHLRCGHQLNVFYLWSRIPGPPTVCSLMSFMSNTGQSLERKGTKANHFIRLGNWRVMVGHIDTSAQRASACVHKLAGSRVYYVILFRKTLSSLTMPVFNNLSVFFHNFLNISFHLKLQHVWQCCEWLQWIIVEACTCEAAGSRTHFLPRSFRTFLSAHSEARVKCE